MSDRPPPGWLIVVFPATTPAWTLWFEDTAEGYDSALAEWEHLIITDRKVLLTRICRLSDRPRDQQPRSLADVAPSLEDTASTRAVVAFRHRRYGRRA